MFARNIFSDDGVSPLPNDAALLRSVQVRGSPSLSRSYCCQIQALVNLNITLGLSSVGGRLTAQDEIIFINQWTILWWIYSDILTGNSHIYFTSYWLSNKPRVFYSLKSECKHTSCTYILFQGLEMGLLSPFIFLWLAQALSRYARREANCLSLTGMLWMYPCL